MARKGFDDYRAFLLEAKFFYRHLDEDFSVGDWDLAKVEAEMQRMKDLNEQVAIAEENLQRLRFQRDTLATEIESFSRRLRGVVLGVFGAGSSQLDQMPSLLHRGPGRPNKSAATLKANTLKRKLAAKMALESSAADAANSADAEAP